jgi:hypothetical protein
MGGVVRRNTVLVGENLREMDKLENLGVDGQRIIKRSFKKWDEGHGFGLMWLRVGTGGGLL